VCGGFPELGIPKRTMDFEYQPILKGSLIELRPLRAEDFEALCEVASDPGIWQQHPVPNRYERAVFQEFIVDALASRGTLVAVDSKSGRIPDQRDGE
jgi:RimJ/RimL family protein N-acetyltransferase